MGTADSSTDHRFLHIESLPLIDLSLLSQSELYSLSLCSSFSASASASHLHRRCDDHSIIPKIDRSVFNESAGSRKQTFSRLRLAPRNKQIPPVSASTVHIPLHNPEPVDEENAQIIGLLQQLFGVESCRNIERDDDCLVPVQVEFKDPLPESAASSFQNIPIDVVDGSPRKRKRGRPRKNENVGIRMEGEPKKVGGDGEEMIMVNEKGVPVDVIALANVGDPFGEELKRRTQGLETESQLLEFLERLNGEWGSQRKKRRIVQASDLGDLLPRGWKIMLSLKRRAGLASIVCRRYVSPDGHQFVSCKEVSTYLLSFFGVQDSHLKSSYTDGSLQLFSNINMASESVVGCVPTGVLKADGIVSCLHLASTSVRTDHEMQATVLSSIGSDKLNNSDGNFNIDLALCGNIGDTINGAFTDFDLQTKDKRPLKADKNDANSVEGCSLEDDRVHNIHNKKLVDAIEASDTACNLDIPLFVSPFSNNNSGICPFSDEINVVRCIRSGISNFASQDGNTGCYETVPCGNEQAHVDNNEHWLSVRLVEVPRQKIGFESSVVAPNSEGKKFTGNSLEDWHPDMEISDGKPVEDDKQRIISSNDQSEIEDVSTNVKLQSSSEGYSLLASQNELKHTSINSTNRILTSLLKDTAEGKCFDSDLSISSSIDERTFVPSGHNNLSFSTCTQDASESGGVDITPDIKVAKDFNDNRAPPNEDVGTSCAEESTSLNDQNCKMDNLLHESADNNKLTPAGFEHPSAFDDNVNKVPAGTFDALKAVEADCKKPQLDIVSCSHDAAVGAYTATCSITQGRSQGCISVPLSGGILNQFDKQDHDGVNNANKSCLSEKAKSDQVEIFQTDSTGMPELR